MEFDDSVLDWEVNSDQEQDFFKKIPLIPPKHAFYLLEKKGYRGQVAGRKSICLTAYRHVKRLKQIYLEKLPRELLSPKSNALLVGPTGCGKTFLIELLFKHILKLPTVIIDVTGFSETGYIGEDTKNILTRLLLGANGNSIIASAGVVCLDEFDKLASNQNNARFEGQGTTKDVSGYGVQRELLKMLEASYIEIPTDFDNTIYSTKQKIFTGDITFIASGAFSNFKASILARDSTPRIGFRKQKQQGQVGIAYSLTDRQVNDISHFHHYGFMPELIARFGRTVAMDPLDQPTLKAILVDNVVKKFEREFRSEGLTLEIEETVLDYIVEESYERQIGARGLGTILIKNLEEIAFEHFCGPKGKIILRLEENQIVTKWEKLPTKSQSSG